MYVVRVLRAKFEMEYACEGEKQIGEIKAKIAESYGRLEIIILLQFISKYLAH